MSDNLFHYTDALAIKSILENRELWLSDIRFLNDSQEMNDGVKYIVDELNSELPELGLDVGFTMYARDFLLETFDDHVSLNIDEQPTFVCSFSEAGDQLSQWRAYGSYAIEFYAENLHSDMGLFPCVYEEAEKKSIAKEMVQDAIHGLTKGMVEHEGEIDPDSLIHLSVLVRTASIFKDPSFYEERETRCAMDVPVIDSRVKFRSRGNVLIPYITQRFSLSAIKAIHIGPMRDQELAYTSMKALIAKVTHDFIEAGGDEISEIDIFKSSVPYRATV